jgi:uncharacterized protein
VTEITPTTTSWLQHSVKDPARLQLTVHVQPGAKRTACAGIHGDALKIRLAAPPVDGKANQALIIWLAKTLGCPQNRIEVIRGQTSRHKTLSVNAGNNIEAIVATLNCLATN